MKSNYPHHKNNSPRLCLLFLTVISMGLLTGCGDLPASCGATSFTLSTSGAELGIGNSALGGISIAMPFQVSSDVTVGGVILALKGNASIGAGNSIQVTIDSGSTPGTAMSSTSSILISTISATGFANYTFTFSSAVSLKAGTSYWVRAKTTAATDASNFVKWAAYNGTGASSYSYGGAQYETGTSTWSQASIGAYRFLDFSFNCQ